MRTDTGVLCLEQVAELFQEASLTQKMASVVAQAMQQSQQIFTATPLGPCLPATVLVLFLSMCYSAVVLSRGFCGLLHGFVDVL